MAEQEVQQNANESIAATLARRHELLDEAQYRFNVQYSEWCDERAGGIVPVPVREPHPVLTEAAIAAPRVSRGAAREPDVYGVPGSSEMTRGPVGSRRMPNTTLRVGSFSDSMLGGRRVSPEEQTLLAENPALADLYLDHNAQGGGAAFAAYQRDREVCESHIPQWDVPGAARVTAVQTNRSMVKH